jgi:hypothetical protein
MIYKPPHHTFPYNSDYIVGMTIKLCAYMDGVLYLYSETIVIEYLGLLHDSMPYFHSRNQPPIYRTTRSPRIS